MQLLPVSFARDMVSILMGGNEMMDEHQMDAAPSPKIDYSIPMEDPTPTPNQSNNQQPIYQQPMYEQPMYQQPMYEQQQPMYQQPMWFIDSD